MGQKKMVRQCAVDNFLDRQHLLVLDQLGALQNLGEQNLDADLTFLVVHLVHLVFPLGVEADEVLRHLLKRDCYLDAVVEEEMLQELKRDCYLDAEQLKFQSLQRAFQQGFLSVQQQAPRLVLLQVLKVQRAPPLHVLLSELRGLRQVRLQVRLQVLDLPLRLFWQQFS